MRVEANGVMLNYSWDGPEDGPVVTMSHSLAANLDMWQPQLAALTDRYRVLRFDTRGHGASDAPDGPYDIALLARDVVALLDALDVARTSFIGLSMGGMIGQMLAIRHADRLDNVMLCDTTSVTPVAAQPMWDQRAAIAEDGGMAPIVEPTIERWFTTHFRAAHGKRVAPIREMIAATPVAGYIGSCQAIKQLDLIDELTDIRVPTLIIVGEDDQGTPVAASEVIHERVKGSRLVILKAAAHLSNWERPDDFNAAIRRFLDRMTGAY